METLDYHKPSRTEADAILWELIENNLSIDNLTKDQRYTMYAVYGENWKGLVNEFLDKTVI